MSDRKFGTPKLYINHEPESSTEVDGNGAKYQAALPGFLEIGVEVDGVQIPLTRRKAGALLPAFDEAKAKSKADAATADTESDDA